MNTEQQIILQAVTAYLDVIRDQLIAEVNEQNVVVLSKQLEAVKDRFEVGVVTRTDIAQSEARLAGAKSGYLTRRRACWAHGRYIVRLSGWSRKISRARNLCPLAGKSRCGAFRRARGQPDIGLGA